MAAKSLKSMLAHLDAGELVLPEIQRDFVWNRRNVLLLFDSLYRDLPIGSMLVWKAKTAVPKRQKGKLNQDILGSFYGYLLDGQQRLTAVQRVRDRHDKYPLLFSLRTQHEERPDSNRFSYATRKTARDPWYTHVADVISKDFSPYFVVERLKELDEIHTDEEINATLGALIKLQNIMNYPVSIIEYDQDDYRRATELFIRFNSTGKKISGTDLASAELALQVQNLVSEKIRPTTAKYVQFRFTMPFMIQCLAAVHTGKMDFRNPQDIWDGSDEKVIKASWRRTAKGVGRVVEFLTGTVKWNSDRWIPSSNAIVPLIYLLSDDKFDSEERSLARKWLLLACVHGLFSKSAHSKVDNILRRLRWGSEEPSVDKLWRISRKELPKLAVKHFETRRKSGAVMSLFISILRNKNAKDWKYQTPLDGNVIGHNAELQVHHFFPQALLRKFDVPTDMINTFANYTILNKETNLDISDEEPIDYVKRHGIKKKDLRVQCIPENRDLWRVERYKDFLAERKRLLTKRTNAFFA